MLKMYLWPFCRKQGYLIMHDYIKGYSDLYNFELGIKGRRIFCSNRNKRKGCGRTWSMYLQLVIPGFSIGIKTLTLIISCKATIFETWKKSFTHLSLSTYYRLHKCFEKQIPEIRTRLIEHFKPPPPQSNPITQTIEHIKYFHPSLLSATALFQTTFQISILS